MLYGISSAWTVADSDSNELLPPEVVWTVCCDFFLKFPPKPEPSDNSVEQRILLLLPRNIP